MNVFGEVLSLSFGVSFLVVSGSGRSALVCFDLAVFSGVDTLVLDLIGDTLK